MERLFPIFVKLRGRRVLVVGAGEVADGKILGLLDTGASIQVVALEISERVQQWADSGAISLEQRAFSPADLDRVFLVITATKSAAVNESVFLEAQARGVLCNVVDVPELCDFFYPALVHRGDLQIAISTGGQSPSLAQKLRKQIERQFGPGYGQWVAELGETRREVLRSNLTVEQKQFLLHSLAGREAFEAMLLAQESFEGKLA
jgi:precorrin-2 dehydrogenase / sirohydrochlorin ferrochelatase